MPFPPRSSNPAQSNGLRDLTPYVTQVSSQTVVEGTLGDIWKGVFRNRRVALKTISVLPPDRSRRRTRAQILASELSIWQTLHNPYVLPLLGTFRLPASELDAMVSPWMDEGNAIDYVRQYPSYDPASLIIDIGKGVRYLHSLNPPIVHGDLRGRNVLIKRGRALLSDFGLSRVLEQVAPGGSGQSIPWSDPRWLAPERLDPDAHQLTLTASLTPASDVYSFGMVVYELYSRQSPFSSVRNRFRVPRVILDGARPDRPTGISDEDWDVVQSCWQAIAAERPDIDDAIHDLDDYWSSEEDDNEDSEDEDVGETGESGDE